MTHGPKRGAHWQRQVISRIGLCLVAAAVAIRGRPEGPGRMDVPEVTGALFGVSADLASRTLVR